MSNRMSPEARIVFAERREEERVRNRARQNARSFKYFVIGRIV